MDSEKLAHPTAGAVQGLWPLAEGTIIAQLLSSEQPPDTAVAKVASLYHMLLVVLPDWETASAPGQGKGRAGLSSALVSGLAFGCNILQGLWRCAGHAMHRDSKTDVVEVYWACYASL